MYDKAD